MSGGTPRHAGRGVSIRCVEVVVAVLGLALVVAYAVVWFTAVADVASSSLPAKERRRWFALLVVLQLAGPYVWFRFSRRRAPYGWPAPPRRGPARG